MWNLNKLIVAAAGLLGTAVSGSDPMLMQIMPWMPEWLPGLLGLLATYMVPNGRPIWQAGLSPKLAG